MHGNITDYSYIVYCIIAAGYNWNIMCEWGGNNNNLRSNIIRKSDRKTRKMGQLITDQFEHHLDHSEYMEKYRNTKPTCQKRWTDGVSEDDITFSMETADFRTLNGVEDPYLARLAKSR